MGPAKDMQQLTNESFRSGLPLVRRVGEINYLKIKIISFIINLDDTMPFVMEKSKSKKSFSITIICFIFALENAYQ